MKVRARNRRGEYQSIDFDQRQSKDLDTSGNIVNLAVQDGEVNAGSGLQDESVAQNNLRSSSTANPMMGSVDGFDAIPNSHRSQMVGAVTSRTLANSSEIHMAENRLRIIEKISKYREEKIKKEFLKLEQELHEENENLRLAQIKEMKQQQYFSEQRDRIAEFQKVKIMKAQEAIQRQQELEAITR